MLWLDECPYCNSPVYRLRDGRIKCSRCYKTLSMKKTDKIITLIDTYIEDKSALSVSKELHLSYVSVQGYYKIFRKLSAIICDEEYEKFQNIPCEYEEYFYLENSKKTDEEAIFDAHNFLIFDYSGQIYTILLPSLQEYKKEVFQNDVKHNYVEKFKKFKRESKIIKVSKHVNNIVNFWNYFEQSILKYKGVSLESFAYFLKEFEFKYNHEKSDAKKLLLKEYFKGNR